MEKTKITPMTFLFHHGISLFLFIIIGFVFFCCLLYLYGVLCDRQPKYARLIAICVWIFTFLQCIFYFFTDHIVIGVIGVIHHVCSISAILTIPNIEPFSKLFMFTGGSSSMAQITLMVCLFSGQFKFYQWVLLFFTYDLIVFFIVASLQIGGKRSISEGMQKQSNIVVTLVTKILTWIQVKGTSLTKRN